MTIEEDDCPTNFLKAYFPQLPNNIIIIIFNLVTSKQLIGFFMHFPDEDIRLVARNNFYRNICLSLIKQGWGSHFSYKRDKYITIKGKDEVVQFLHCLPNIISKRLVIEHAEIYFKDINEILRTYRDTISKFDELAFFFILYQFDFNNFNYLLSFSNLTELKIFGKNSKFLGPWLVDNQMSIHHPKLNTIAIRSHRIENWSGIKFPKNLKYLELSESNNIDISTLELPAGINSLSLHFCKITNSSIIQNELPEKLHVLDLKGIELESTVIENLPIGLFELKLSLCGIDTISENAWPLGLTYLDISKNQFTTTENLKGLPKDLQYLNISANPFNPREIAQFKFSDGLTTLKMVRSGLVYLPHIPFPRTLKELDLSCNTIYTVLKYDWINLVNLESLDLLSCSIKNLKGWNIPPNLKKLILQSNPIKRLTQDFPLFDSSYNYNLVELCLRDCSIDYVNISYIPPSLKVLDLSENPLASYVVLPSFKGRLRLPRTSYSGSKVSTLIFENRRMEIES